MQEQLKATELELAAHKVQTAATPTFTSILEKQNELLEKALEKLVEICDAMRRDDAKT